jgi:hypothetical protein
MRCVAIMIDGTLQYMLAVNCIAFSVDDRFTRMQAGPSFRQKAFISSVQDNRHIMTKILPVGNRFKKKYITIGQQN